MSDQSPEDRHSNPRNNTNNNNSRNNQRKSDPLLNYYNQNPVNRITNPMFFRPKKEARLSVTYNESQIMKVPFADYRSDIAREKRRKF